MPKATLTRPRLHRGRQQLVPRALEAVMVPTPAARPSRPPRALKTSRADVAEEEWREAMREDVAQDEGNQLGDGVVPDVAAQVDAPTPAPVDPASPSPTHATPLLDLTAPTFEDFDNVWDWCRQNPQGAARYFGELPRTHADMSHRLQLVIEGQERGASLLRSIYGQGVHLGIASLVPINRSHIYPHAVAHIFLRPEMEGQLQVLLPFLCDEFAKLEPTLALTVHSTDYAFAKLLQPYGFTLQIALTRPPLTKDGRWDQPRPR